MRPGAGLYSRKVVFKHTLRYRPDQYNQTPECAWQSSQPPDTGICRAFPPCGAVLARCSAQRLIPMIHEPHTMEEFIESLENVAITPPDDAAARLFVVSDIHSDYEANMAWCRSLADSGRFRRDTLIVAGDVSHSLEIVRETLAVLVAAFDRVWFVPGNHDLWVWTTSIGARGKNAVPGGEDSLTKLRQTMELCAELGVHTAPGYAPALGLIIVPLTRTRTLTLTLTLTLNSRPTPNPNPNPSPQP